jgi:hypothetical protein
MPVGLRPEEIIALGHAGLAGDSLLESLTGSSGDRLGSGAAVHARLPLPQDAGDVVVWMSHARRLADLLQEGVVA